jgi:hypothetical protein
MRFFSRLQVNRILIIFTTRIYTFQGGTWPGASDVGRRAVECPQRTAKAPLLAGHVVREAKAQGWDTLSYGALLTVAESAGFDVLVSLDKNIR